MKFERQSNRDDGRSGLKAAANKGTVVRPPDPTGLFGGMDGLGARESGVAAPALPPQSKMATGSRTSNWHLPLSGLIRVNPT